MSFPPRSFLLLWKNCLEYPMEPLSRESTLLNWNCRFTSLIFPLSLSSRKEVLWVTYSPFYSQLLAKYLYHKKGSINGFRKQWERREGKRKVGERNERDANQSASHSVRTLPTWQWGEQHLPCCPPLENLDMVHQMNVIGKINY